MNASAGLAWSPGPQQELDELQVWMESLASGSWSADEFLREVLRLERHDSGLAWDVLTLLEQYHHRERIPHELFICVRSRLKKHLDRGLIPAPADQALPPQAPAPAADGLRPGDLILGRYRITDITDRNACCLLLEAVDEHRLDVPDVCKRVAICLRDVVRPQSIQLLQRIYRLQGLSHPCIQKVFDVDEHQCQLFVTQEWLTGISVAQLLDLNSGQPLSISVARTLLRAVARGLTYAHGHGVSHGGLDASSVFVTDTGEIKLRGFERPGLLAKSDAAEDRKAFADFAYRLLSGSALPEVPGGRPARKSALRQPRGLPRQEWKVLRQALLDRDSPALLRMFAGDEDFAAGRYLLAPPPARPQRHTAAWLAAGAIAVALAAAGFQ